MTKRPVTTELARTLPVSLILTALAFAIATVVGVFVGVVSAVRQFSILDDVLRIVVMAGVSMPIFWFGMLLIIVFSVRLGMFPAFGWGSVSHVVMPSVALATYPLAMIARLTRSSMLEVLRQDYVRTALAKGLHKHRMVYGHALRNALIPVITVIGIQFGVLLAGSVLTETIFAIPGLGRLTIDAVLARDYPIIRGTILLATFVFLLINFLVDLVYLYLNPRIRIWS